MSIEYDEEFMEGSIAIVQLLEAELNSLLEKTKSDSYQFEDNDLGYMTAIAGSNPGIMPFRELLLLVNQTHRKGLESE